MTTSLIAHRTDYLARLVDPEDFGVDADDAERLLDSGTATMKVFDPGVDEVSTAAVALGQTTIPVTNVGVFVTGTRVELEATDGSFHNTTIDSVDSVAGTIELDDVLTVGIASGARVRGAFLTAPAAMPLFGTPTVGGKNWGYQAPLTDTGLHQTIGQEGVAEMTLDAGSGLKIIKLECFKVVESCEL